MSSEMDECQAYVPWIMTLLEKAKLDADPVEFFGKALTEILANTMVVDKCSWVSPLEPGTPTWLKHSHGCLVNIYPTAVHHALMRCTRGGIKGWWNCLQRELPRRVKCHPCHSLTPCASACSTDHPGFHYSPEGEMKSSYQPKEGTTPHRVRRKSGE